MTLAKNVGKGGAIQQGMLHARGARLLMVDADGATRISDFDKLDERLNAVERNGFGVALGSRAHLEDDAIAQVGMLMMKSNLNHTLYFPNGHASCSTLTVSSTALSHFCFI